jgi:hypothetical protein
MADQLPRLSNAVERMASGGSIAGGDDLWPGTDLRRSSIACATARYLNCLGPDPSDPDGERAFELVRESRARF